MIFSTNPGASVALCCGKRITVARCGGEFTALGSNPLLCQKHSWTHTTEGIKTEERPNQRDTIDNCMVTNSSPSTPLRICTARFVHAPLLMTPPQPTMVDS